MSLRSRNWCFTINNYTSADISLLTEADCRYLVYGKETGDNGTPHLQCYVMYSSLKSLKQMKEWHATAHFEKAMGDSLQNYNYCTKDGVFHEIHERPLTQKEQGKAEKERWATARRLAVEGNMDGIDDDIYIRYYRTLKAIAFDHVKPKDDLDGCCGVWIWGPPGSGKSRKAREDYPGIFDKPCNKWFDSYRDGPILLDDLDSKCLGHHLKRWADRYSFTAEIKGGSISARPQKVVVTSNYSIEEIFHDDPMMAQAIARRFEVIYLA